MSPARTQDAPRSPGRRRATGLLLAVPAAAAWPGALIAEPASPEPPKTSPLAEFIASQQKGLDPQERQTLVRGVVQLEDALEVIRDFEVGNDVPPALRFAALRAEPRR
jgi:hypothetical protein